VLPVEVFRDVPEAECIPSPLLEKRVDPSTYEFGCDEIQVSMAVRVFRVWVRGWCCRHRGYAVLVSSIWFFTASCNVFSKNFENCAAFVTREELRQAAYTTVSDGDIYI